MIKKLILFHNICLFSYIKLITEEKHISSKCINDEENFENNSVIESESSAIYDDDENSREAKSVCSEGSSQVRPNISDT